LPVETEGGKKEVGRGLVFYIWTLETTRRKERRRGGRRDDFDLDRQSPYGRRKAVDISNLKDTAEQRGKREERISSNSPSIINIEKRQGGGKLSFLCLQLRRERRED